MQLNTTQYRSININTAQLKLLWIIGVGEGSANFADARAYGPVMVAELANMICPNCTSNTVFADSPTPFHHLRSKPSYGQREAQRRGLEQGLRRIHNK
jgi:hypothetical protein